MERNSFSVLFFLKKTKLLKNCLLYTSYNKPLATSYTYIRFLDKKVQLPEKKNKDVYKRQAHGGTIRIESEVGKGSTFVIRFNV